MSLRTIALFLSSMLLAAACAPGKGQDSRRMSESQIKNGRMPDTNSPIAHSAILVNRTNSNGTEFYCSGVVLSKNIVLTAAHCVTEAHKVLPPESIRLDNAFAFLGAPILVEKVLVTQEYLASVTNFDSYDMALIKLRSDLPADYVPALIETDFKKAMGKTLFSAGFGLWGSDSGDENSTKALAVGEMTPVSEIHFEASDRTLLFKGSNYGPALCVGDSGGPVYFEEDGKVRLIGINVEFQFPIPGKVKKKDPLCADGRSQEVVDSVMSESYHFIAEGFEELSGNPLPKANSP